MTKEILLVGGLKAKVDDEDYDWLTKYKWEAIDIEDSIHAFTIIKGKGYLMENMIMEHSLGPYQKRNMK